MVRILIVDAAPFMRKLIVALVSDEGHQVVGEGEDGQQAVTLYFTTRPDVLLIDLMMPRKDGVQATREILGRDRNARVIVVSSSGAPAEVDWAARAAGPRASLMKPIQPADLRAALDTALAPRLA